MANQVDQVLFDPVPGAGTYTLTLNPPSGQVTTDPISVSASAADVQTACEAKVGGGNIVVSAVGGGFQFTYQGDLAEQALTPLTCDASNLFVPDSAAWDFTAWLGSVVTATISTAGGDTSYSFTPGGNDVTDQANLNGSLSGGPAAATVSGSIATVNILINSAIIDFSDNTGGTITPQSTYVATVVATVSTPTPGGTDSGGGFGALSGLSAMSGMA